MSLSKNSIRPIDVSTTPIKLKYSSIYTSSWDGYDQGQTFFNTPITANFGRNTDATRFDITGSQARVYRMVRQLYYQQYFTGSILNASSSWDWNQQSTACSGSSEYENRYLPTESTARIAVICIPPKVFGEQISKNTVNLRPIIGEEYNIIDDGNGNLIDTINNNLHIGNVIYSPGLIIITDQNYAPGFVVPTTPPDPYYDPTGSVQGYADTTPTSYFVEFTP